MTIKKVLNENPEITDELREFFKEMLLSSMKDNDKLPKSFIDAVHSDGVSTVLVENYLTSNPRLICDFMDEQDVIILITNHDNIGWSFTINGQPHKGAYDSRKEAETQSVISSINFYKEMPNKNDE